jgi:tetratricopeptide (TPR) repeat protein
MSISAFRRSRIAAGLGLALACSSVSRLSFALEPAAAEPALPSSSVTDADRAHAAERYREGVEAYRAHRYKDAIDAFAEADKLSPSAALSFNSALAYEQLLDVPNALRMYREYLRRSGTREKADQARQRVQELERRLASRGVQQVSIFSEPSGATVSIDGRAMGVTPWTSELPPGPHRLVLSMKAHDDVVENIDVPRDHAIDAAFELEVATPHARPAPAPKSEPVAASGHPLGAWPWVVLGVGGAAVATSIGFELSRRSAESDARNATSQTGYAEHLDAMDSRQAAARWFGAAGGGLLLASGVLFLLDARGSHETGATVNVASDRCFLTYRSSF